MWHCLHKYWWCSIFKLWNHSSPHLRAFPSKIDLFIIQETLVQTGWTQQSSVWGLVTCSGWRCVSWHGGACTFGGSSLYLHLCWMSSWAPAARRCCRSCSNAAKHFLFQKCIMTTMSEVWMCKWSKVGELSTNMNDLFKFFVTWDWCDTAGC